MNDSDSKNSAAAQLAKPKSTTVSERKLKANRENAKKSTGPRTSRGKAYSLRNARKRGLFIRDKEEFLAKGDPWGFETYYKRLRYELQPIGPCEETEVEYIAICWMRLQRLWRYENAEARAPAETPAGRTGSASCECAFDTMKEVREQQPISTKRSQEVTIFE